MMLALLSFMTISTLFLFLSFYLMAIFPDARYVIVGFAFVFLFVRNYQHRLLWMSAYVLILALFFQNYFFSFILYFMLTAGLYLFIEKNLLHEHHPAMTFFVQFLYTFSVAMIYYFFFHGTSISQGSFITWISSFMIIGLILFLGRFFLRIVLSFLAMRQQTHRITHV